MFLPEESFCFLLQLSKNNCYLVGDKKIRAKNNNMDTHSGCVGMGCRGVCICWMCVGTCFQSSSSCFSLLNILLFLAPEVSALKRYRCCCVSLNYVLTLLLVLCWFERRLSQKTTVLANGLHLDIDGVHIKAHLLSNLCSYHD